MGADTYPVIDLVATGKNICDLRKAKGLTVADLQEYFGFEAPQAIYKWQAGKTLPSTDNLFALSYLLEVPIDEILIPIKPRIKSLPQEDSCGVVFLVLHFCLHHYHSIQLFFSEPLICDLYSEHIKKLLPYRSKLFCKRQGLWFQYRRK